MWKDILKMIIIGIPFLIVIINHCWTFRRSTYPEWKKLSMQQNDKEE